MIVPIRQGKSRPERWRDDRWRDDRWRDDRWRGLLAAVGLPGGAAAAGQAVYDELDRRYREPHRHYHAWPHIDSCLAELERARSCSPHPGALELAIWFHDAVYEPGAADNEARSAALAREAAERLGLPAALSAEAEALVLATRHLGGGPAVPAAPREPAAPGACAADTALILDIDLAIFGRPWRAFAAYEEGIAREYQGVPEAQRRARRCAILQGFLERPRIYLTDAFHRRYERRARRNLRRSIARLARGAPRPP